MRNLRSIGASAAAAAVVFGSAGAAVAFGPGAGGRGAAQDVSAASATSGSAGAAPGALPAGKSWTVTLVTGDVVRVRAVAGAPAQVSIQPGAGRRGVAFSEYLDSLGHIRVLPHDVAPLIGKVLDPTLFDVTTLITDGDADGARPTLPLIVRGAGGVSGPAAAARLASALRPGKDLPSIDAEAVSEPKSQAPGLGSRLAAMASGAVRAGRLTPEISEGLEYVWLDRTVRTSGVSAAASALADADAGPSAGTLDHNLTQIGAPAAWQRGGTGRGVTVAVLDTGVDAAFPDLAGRIAGTANFSSSPDAVDRFGHGTFVAAQIAGSGAAAHGERRGVAYDSRLLIGKVLGDDGSGQDSDVIAGMQWAAPRARVISMSIGQPVASDGTDPLSAAVDQLSVADGVLFVIAAGNYGPGEQTVGIPGAAGSALTVGAVDGHDVLAPFSSRGPRAGDYAIKPEIVAPGVDIAGARAAGTRMGTVIDSHYVLDSGTSMAAPEVAGAAAILYQLHPDWSARQVKADLVATAHPATGGDVYELGEGRLDIGAAVTATVTLDQAVADLGTISNQATAPITDTLILTDVNAHPETVSVSAELTDRAGAAVPAGAISVSGPTAHLSAGGKASVTVVLRPRQVTGRPGLYEGHVSVRDGNRVLRIPISLQITPPQHLLTLKASALAGTGAGGFFGYAQVVNADDPTLYATFVSFGSDGTATLQVPDGDYWVSGEVDDNSGQLGRSALVGEPDVPVAGDTTVSLDAAHAAPVTASVTGRATEYDGTDVFTERAIGGELLGTGVYSFATTTQPLVYAQSTGAARTGGFRVSTGYRLLDPATPAAYTYNLFHNLGDRIPGNLDYVLTEAVQRRLARVDEHFYAVDGNTMPYLETVYGLTDSGFLALQFISTVPGASTRTDYFSTEPGIGWTQEAAPPITLGGTTSSGQWVTEIPGFTHYPAGSRSTADWARQVFRPGPYSATAHSTSGCAPNASTRSAGNIHVELVDLQDLPDGFDCLGGGGEDSATMRLSLDGRTLGTVAACVGDFAVPSGPSGNGTYTLAYDNATSALPVSTATSTTWTFRSSAPSGPTLTRLALLTVDYSLPLDLDNHPNGDTAILTVRRVAGSGSARVTGLRLWTSLDGGATWTAAPVRALGDGRFAAGLPRVATGQGVSLRVQAADAGGSTITQTVITAYHG